ncbi:MAG: transcription termination/antitermination NusG family protein [Candidatus Tenebribacter davisii]|nr:transcription termination/antitermination NusG family protein [Candidatus Tenebribacter davisii]
MVTNKPVEIDELFGDLNPGVDNFNWYVVHTKPRCEKKLAKFSQQYQINYYLPLIDSIRVYKNRKIKFTKPMFPGYVFVKCEPKKKQQLTLTGYVAYWLPVQNQIELINDLQQIYSGRELGVEFIRAEFLDKGTKVEIQKGPFAGLIGYVEDQKNIKEVILQVTLLRQAVSVSAKADQVRVVN